MPLDPELGTTKGFAFIEYQEASSAKSAVENLNGFRLDRSHIFAVNPYEDFEKLSKVPDEYIAPQPKEYEEKENLYWWLVDKENLTNDQFVVLQGSELI